MVSTIHLHVLVESVQSRASTIVPGEEITVGLALNAPVDIKAAVLELKAAPGVAMYLVRSPVFDYDVKIWSVLDDGNFLGEVGDGATVRFPVLDVAQQGLVPKDLSVDDLLREPTKRQIVVKIVDGDQVRVP